MTIKNTQINYIALISEKWFHGVDLGLLGVVCDEAKSALRSVDPFCPWKDRDSELIMQRSAIIYTKLFLKETARPIF